MQRRTGGAHFIENFFGVKEKLFTQGGAGSKEANWIWPKKVYEFRMYAGKEHKQLLAVVKVRKE